MSPTGLEPAHLSTLESRSNASANSATRTFRGIIWLQYPENILCQSTTHGLAMPRLHRTAPYSANTEHNITALCFTGTRQNRTNLNSAPPQQHRTQRYIALPGQYIALVTMPRLQYAFLIITHTRQHGTRLNYTETRQNSTLPRQHPSALYSTTTIPDGTRPNCTITPRYFTSRYSTLTLQHHTFPNDPEP